MTATRTRCCPASPAAARARRAVRPGGRGGGARRQGRTSFIQRHLHIGYNRAAKLIEQMEKEGMVGAANHVGKREVLVRRTHDDMDC